MTLKFLTNFYFKSKKHKITNRTICIIIAIDFFLSAINAAQTNNLDFNQLYFETAQSIHKKFLIDFAIQSNDIYQTRTVDKKIAEDVFDIDETIFLEGVVELLKRGEEIVGFFSLKIHKCISKQQLECELGHLFVKAGLQRKGLGTILFERAVKIAQTRGFKKLTWISDPDAEKFYLKKSAQIIGYDDNLLNPAVKLPLFEYDI